MKANKNISTCCIESKEKVDIRQMVLKNIFSKNLIFYMEEPRGK
jgi:hypothetical protein